MTLLWATITSVFFIAALVLHAVVCRLPISFDRVLRFIVVGFVLGIFLAWALANSAGFLSIEMLAGLLLYAFLCELYIFLFTMTISSISSNILVRLFYGPMSINEIGEKYNSLAMVDARIQRLVDTGFLKRTDNNIGITSKGMRLVKILSRLRIFFKHD